MDSNNNQSINMQIEKFRYNLFNYINSCELPIGIAYYICKSIFQDLEDAYHDSLQEEWEMSHEENNNITKEQQNIEQKENQQIENNEQKEDD